MKNWITDRRSTEVGEYWVTLEYESGEYVDGKYDREHFIPNGTIHRWVDMRYFSEPLPATDCWAMEGEDPHGLHWTQQTGSMPLEHVVAWMPIEEVEVYRGDLREGKNYVFESDAP